MWFHLIYLFISENNEVDFTQFQLNIFAQFGSSLQNIIWFFKQEGFKFYFQMSKVSIRANDQSRRWEQTIGADDQNMLYTNFDDKIMNYETSDLGELKQKNIPAINRLH